jgi:flagellar basal body-associated protein FliL
MRKVFVIITVVALILSVVGTGVVVFIETKNQTSESSSSPLPNTETSPAL